MRLFWKIWKIIFKVAFFPTVLMLLLLIVSGALTGVLTYCLNLLFQNVYLYLQNKATLQQVILFGGIVGGLYLLEYLLKIMLVFIRPNFLEKIKINVLNNVHQSISLIPMEEYENLSIYNDIYMVNNFVNGPHFMIFFFGSLSIITTIISLVSIIVALALFSPWLILIALLSILPIFILRLVRGKQYYQMQVYQAPKQRFLNYLFSLFIDPFSLREMRCYGFNDYLEQKWVELNKDVTNEEFCFTKKSSLYQLGADLFKTFGLALAIVLIIILTFNNKITFGQFGTSLIIFRNVQSSFHSILNQLAQIASKMPYLGKVFIIFDKAKQYQEIGKNQFENFNENIELENVSFYYPSSNHKVLEDINLKIENGKLIAIVGENGAGKTTLVKVLMGLFKPTSGVVKYDGVDINYYQSQSITNDTSAVFQNFTRYALSLRENVAISDIRNIDNDDKIISCLEQVDLTDLLQKCNYQLDCNLRKDFGGLELSGGQWQKVAIARGIFRQSNLIIFDEPTAAIDPLLENKIFALFKELTKDRTSILVSHRIGPTKMADEIIVLEKGRIVEKGTFKELMDLKGKYYELYTLQAQWYQE